RDGGPGHVLNGLPALGLRFTGQGPSRHRFGRVEGEHLPAERGEALPLRMSGGSTARGDRRAALVTGCGRRNGIGAAVARALAAEGIDVPVSDLAPTGVPNTSE